MKTTACCIAGAVSLVVGGCSVSSHIASADAGAWLDAQGATGSVSPPDASPLDAGLDGSADASTDWAIVPGKSVGPISLGETYGAVKALLGAGTATSMAHSNFVTWPAMGLKVVFASSSDSTLSDDAIALAIGVFRPSGFSGQAIPGATLTALTAAMGATDSQVGPFMYWASGASAQLDATNTSATAVAVFPPYTPESQAPEMTQSHGPGLSPKVPDAGAISVVDMHLHPGHFGRIPEATKQYLIGTLPDATKLFAPPALMNPIDPYAPFVGIKAETAYAGADHAVLFAVYTQHTTGWFSNEELEAVLTDPRNTAADGLPWAWGLASIDFFDGFVSADGGVNAQISASRYAALGSYFAKRRDLFIGIKLAHAHQSVAFDDARYLGVYDVAKTYNVPVYLHTGFTPFPGASDTPAYYDPNGLENTIINLPTVKFILGHVGQGDEAAVGHALALAKKYANVYLEISALGLPLLVEADGGAADAGSTPQYPYVLEQIRSLGIIDKTIFGTDGPQYDGMGKGYVTAVTGAMTNAGYDSAEIRSVMSQNFLRVFFGVWG